MDEGSGYCGSGSEIESVSNAAEIATLERDEICLKKDSVESNLKPRFFADRLGIMSFVEGRERGVGCFRGLLRETDRKKFNFRGIGVR